MSMPLLVWKPLPHLCTLLCTLILREGIIRSLIVATVCLSLAIGVPLANLSF